MPDWSFLIGIFIGLWGGIFSANLYYRKDLRQAYFELHMAKLRKEKAEVEAEEDEILDRRIAR